MLEIAEIQLDEGIPPWEEFPYRLVSLWDMQKFLAPAFYELGTLLKRIERLTEHRAEIETAAGSSIFSLLPSIKQRIAKQTTDTEETQIATLRIAEHCCADIGLTQSLKHIKRLQESIQSLGPVESIAALKELHLRIRDELEDRLFMYIPSDRAEFYDKSDLFGKDVIAKFPSIQFDMVEAGNCYAAGRGTAVVFHLMRIMETGVQALGNKLSVPLVDEKNWQVILNETEKAFKALPKASQSVEMAQVLANLYAVKLAWRNSVMHPKDTYTLEEAGKLIGTVKLFMEQLAKII
jgi:hypothetical protein